MNKYSDALARVQQRIVNAEQRYMRTAGTVKLLAVSKGQSAHAMRLLAAAGQQRFAESYVQEAMPKLADLSNLNIEWHFIGPIQSNKTKSIAEHFAWVHSVDRLKIAQRLSEQRPEALPPLNICIQVNVDQESTKAGVSIEDLVTLAHQVAKLPNLRLRGLMTIPARREILVEQRAPYKTLRELLQNLTKAGLPLDVLSMGMSGDFEAAIAEGATYVRVGTALFGARIYGNG
jgi:pyridoxal phosphate enzyme (YggS family)